MLQRERASEGEGEKRKKERGGEGRSAWGKTRQVTAVDPLSVTAHSSSSMSSNSKFAPCPSPHTTSAPSPYA
eukprot:3430325-Rhodomonas_salina.2